MADDHRRERGAARVTVSEGPSRPTLLPRRRPRADRHSRKRVAFMHYAYYDVAFQFFVEHVLDADYVRLPKATRRTLEIGSENSNDYVCAPFKHILGDYVEALEAGANVLVQFTGFCRLTYYGELQEMILRDMGYEDFEMLNFSAVSGRPFKDYVTYCKKVVNPNLSVTAGVANMLALLRMIELLDAYNDAYLANAGFEVEAGSFERAREAFFDDMRCATGLVDVNQAYRRGMEALRALPVDKPANPCALASPASSSPPLTPRATSSSRRSSSPCTWSSRAASTSPTGSSTTTRPTCAARSPTTSRMTWAQPRA